jgi:hypothetical protein
MPLFTAALKPEFGFWDEACGFPLEVLHTSDGNRHLL